eukprot:6645347-Pyramimonas_sp.AAC.1
MFGDFFHPSTRCGYCGCWLARAPQGPMCIVCHRLATPLCLAVDAFYSDSAEAPGHPLDTLGTRLSYQLAR